MSNVLRYAIGRDWSRRKFVWTGLGAIAAPVLVGCSDATPTEPTPTARSAAFTPGREFRSLAAPEGKNDSRTREHRGTVSCTFHPSYAAAEPAPLFVALHGYGATSDDWLAYIDHAEARGFVLLAPESRSISWTDADSIGPDVAFIDDGAAAYVRSLPDRPEPHCFRRVLGWRLVRHLPRSIERGPFHEHARALRRILLARLADRRQTSVYQSHGTNDQILSISLARDDRISADRDGYDVTFDEFVGGHQLPPRPHKPHWTGSSTSADSRRLGVQRRRHRRQQETV